MPGLQPVLSEVPAAAPSSPGKGWFRLRLLVLGALTGLLLAALWEAGGILIGDNFHVVLAGQVYRCAQPTRASLEGLIRAYHIRTVVNLRGCGGPFPWYLEECRASHGLNVNQEDIAFSAGRLPSSTELRRFIEVLDHCEYPIVLHCRHGADRTGMAVAILLLLNTETSLAEACGQMSLRYGHVALGRPAYLDDFFALYRDWLQARTWSHSRAHFRQWVEREYCPAECRCRLELPGFSPLIPRDQPLALAVRVRNTSVKTWRFQPESNAGIHLRYVLWNDAGDQVTDQRSGLFDAVVPPGRSIDLALALPPLKKPGRYRLLVDMVDEKHCWFFQTGSEPVEKELEVRD